MNEKITFYGHTATLNVFPLRALLDQSKIEYAYINTSHDKEAEAVVKEINNGKADIITFVFPDKSTLSKPSINELRDKLVSLSYEIPQRAWLFAQIRRMYFLIGVVLLILMIIKNISIFL